MKKWLQNLSSAVIASLLAITLNGKAYANNDEQSTPVVPQVQAEQPAGQTASQGFSANASAVTAVAPVTSSAEPETQPASVPGNDDSASGSDAHASGNAVSVSGNDSLTSGNNVSVSGNDSLTSGNNVSASGDDASASGDNVSASDSDSLSSCNDASVSDSYTPAANALTGGANSLVSSNMPAVTDGDTDGPFENTAVTKDQAGMKRGVEDIVSAAGMRGGEVPAGAGDNNENVESGDSVENGNGENRNGENGNGENGSGENGSGENSTDFHSNQVSKFNQDDKGSYVLVNYSMTEALSADDDITIRAAGLNYIPKLSVDGNINLIGSGILLVDKIEMAEGKEFSLQPNKEIYGDDYSGGVAVFLKQDNGDYLLINGSEVAGILDEEYEIPAGVTLVVPGDSRLVMQSLAAGLYTSQEGEKTIRYSTESEGDILKHLPGYQETSSGYSHSGDIEFNSTSPILTILEQAKLVIQEQAALIMNSIGHRYGSSLVPTLDVQGTLELEGTVSSNEIKGTVEISGTVTGSGRVCNEQIFVLSDQTALTAESSVIRLRESSSADDSASGQNDTLSIGTLTAYGSNDLIFSDSHVSNLVLHDGASVDALGYKESCLLTLGDISGSGTMVYSRGTFTAGTVAEETVTEKLFTRKPLIREGVIYVASPEGDLTAVPAQAQLDSIKVVNVEISEIRRPDGIHYDLLAVENKPRNSGNDSNDSENESQNRDSISFAESTTVGYSELVDKLAPEVPAEFSNGGAIGYIEIYSVGEGGEIKRTVLPLANPLSEDDIYLFGWLQEDYTDYTTEAKIPAADIRLIRTVVYKWGSQSSGGGTSTSTNTSYTGSGILGGSGAGSLSGGTARPILTGTGLHSNDNSQDTSGPKLTDLMAYVDEAQQKTTLVWVEVAPEVDQEATTPRETAYVLLTLEGEKTLKELGGKATVSMSYVPPAEYEGKPLYIVFRNRDNTLTAIRATYSNITKHLVFIADRLGEFMIVGFDFDGEEFSPEFYEALAKLPELKNLIFSEVGTV